MKKITSLMMKQFSDENPERFNKDLLTIKEKDDEKEYLDIILSSLGSIDGIEYCGLKEIKYKVFKKEMIKEDLENEFTIDIEKSNLKLYRATFNIKKDGKEEVKLVDFYYPRMCRGGIFIINNTRYIPVFQLLDSGFYNTPKSVVLKTLSMPIVVREKDVMFLDIFKNKTPIFMYLFAKFGYRETLDRMGYSNEISIIEKADIESLDMDVVTFDINKKICLAINEDFYNTHESQVKTILACFNNRVSVDKIFELDYWKKRLGGIFTTSNSKIEKSEAILKSLERCFDNLTKKFLKIDDNYKVDIYSIIEYMIEKYSDIMSQDNLDLKNKRIRCQEYLCYPLQPKINKFMYRITNSKPTFERLSKFYIPKGFLVKKAVTNELLRYDNSVNSINIINKLKFTQNGPQSQFGSGSVNIKYRTIHESYLGKIGLLSTSAGDPGCSGTLTPFVEFTDDMHFKEI